MPLTTLYLPDTINTVGFVTPKDSNVLEGNPFEKISNSDVDMNEWEDWMRWEGGSAGLDLPTLAQGEILSSNMSSPETWSVHTESAQRSILSPALSAYNGFQFDENLFNADGVMLPYQTMPVGPDSNALPSRTRETTQNIRRSFSGLSEAEERRLQDIAMPWLEAEIRGTPEQTSPTSSHSFVSQSPSPDPEPRKRKSSKRKSLVTDSEVPAALCLSRKRGHNAIEKRYRTNLNEKINCLRDGIPSLCLSSNSEVKDGDDAEYSEGEGLDNKNDQQKYGKAAVLTRALEYIKHLENTTQRLGGENNSLKTRIGAFEKLAMNGSIALNETGNPGTATGTILVQSKTLEDIQADFKQIKYQAMPAPTIARRKGSKAIKSSQ